LSLTFTTVAAMTFWAAQAVGQDSTTATTAATATPQAAQPAATAPAVQPATASQAAPQLSYGVAEVVQLVHANVGEDVIVNYVQNSGNAYGLDASQILYLKQQGVSDRIVNAMLGQHSRVAATQAATPQNYPAAGNAPTATAVPQPAATYAQSGQPSSVYVIPDTQTYNYYANSYPYYYYPYYYYPYYYPYYYGWPAVSFSFGYYGGGYYGGYHYHNGGYGGAWHYGGGSYHGGGGGGGSYHGGGGGGHH